MGKFVIKKDAKGEFRFNLKAGNGEIILSSEGYSSMAACKNGIASVQKNSVAAVEDQTVEGYATVKNPKFEVYKDKKGEFRFRLKASNGEPIGTGEGYKAKAGCMNGIESIKKNAPDAQIVDETAE
ncbi:MAG: YegP family protein [Paludibacteraceae bacterium]|nr:YegP family protein [Paludibacteraceae bacterium]